MKASTYENRWRTALANLNTWKRGNERAVHKPLLTLVLIARAEAGLPGHVSFKEINEPLKKLLREFGPVRKNYQPEYPFWHLQSDGFWGVTGKGELPNRTAGNSPSATTLLKLGAVGAVPPDLWKPLTADAVLRWELAALLLDAFWPPTLHAGIRLAVGLPADPPLTTKTRTRRVRDPKFREEVFRAYQRRRAVCGYDGRLADMPLGIEAAHIRWHAYDGPEDVSNGLALCSFHHITLDSGALSVAAEGYIVVSADVTGDTLTTELLFRFEGHALRRPLPAFAPPADAFLAWHRKEVFKYPGRTKYTLDADLPLAAEDPEPYSS